MKKIPFFLIMLFVYSQLSAATKNNDSLTSITKAIATAFFYWYDDETGMHLGDIGSHPPVQEEKGRYPGYSYKNKQWFYRELKDMMEAGIDIVAVQFWGNPSNDFWSIPGLINLLESLKDLSAQNYTLPRVAPYIDTSAVIFDQFKKQPQLKAEMERGDKARRWVMTLNNEPTMRALYECIKKPFRVISSATPTTATENLALANSPYWRFLARNDGFPMVFIYEAGRGFFFWDWDQRLFENVVNWFERDFGLKPRLYPDYEWSLKDTDDDQVAFNLNGGGYIRWRAAVYEPYVMNTPVQMPRKGLDCVQIGPGYDDRYVPGRTKNGHPIRSRDFGYFYCYGWQYALRSQRNLVMLESWNEFHESTNICDSREFGRNYIRLTRQYVRKFKTDYSRFPVVWCELKHTNEDFLTVINNEEGLYQVDGGVVRYKDQKFGKEETDYLIDTPPATDGKTAPDWSLNKQCRRTQLPEHPFIYFDIDDGWVNNCKAQKGFKGFYITVEYFDKGRDSFRIRYDAEPSKFTPPVKKTDSHSWRMHTFYLTDAQFNNAQAQNINYYKFLKKGCDFSLDSMQDGDEWISRVFVSPAQAFLLIEPEEKIYLGTPAKIKISLIAKEKSQLNPEEEILLTANKANVVKAETIKLSVLFREPCVREVTFSQPGRFYLIARGKKDQIGGFSPEFLVQKFRLIAEPVSLKKEEVKFKLIALNEKGEPDRNYEGEVWFPPVRAGDSCPGEYKFTKGEAGVHQFSISFRNYGQNAIYVQERENFEREGREEVIIPPPRCDIELTNPPAESGLHLISRGDGLVQPAKKGKSSCYQISSTNPQSRYLYLNIADELYYDLPRYNDFYVNVEYFDEGRDSFFLQYDSHDNFDAPDGFKTVPLQEIKKNNTKKWRWASFRLEDARFVNRTNQGDFRIDAGAGDEYIRRVSVSCEPGIYKGVDFKVAVENSFGSQRVKISGIGRDGNLIKDYQGTICIVSLESEQPPLYYNFRAEDQGAHSYSLSQLKAKKLFVYEVGNLNQWVISNWWGHL